MFCQNQRSIKGSCERFFGIIMLVTVDRMCSFRFVAVVNSVNFHDVAIAVSVYFFYLQPLLL